MKRKSIALTIIQIAVMVLCTNFVFAASVNNLIPRISGSDRYSTSRLLSEQFINKDADCVVLTTGSNYADALGASVLAFQKQAPILLAGDSLDASSEAVSFIKDHLKSDGTVYIMGGKGVIGEGFETYFTSKEYKVKRLGGISRYETDVLIAEQLNALKSTPIVIASGENFPDALSMSSPAAANGWPILLVEKNSISQEVINYISKLQPSKVYIGGGAGVISSDVETKIKQLVPGTQIVRIQGRDRYETSINIAKFFYPDSALQFLSSGINFPDALAGSVLAAKNKSPILLIDDNQSDLPEPLFTYFSGNKNRNKLDFIILGGEGVITNKQEEMVVNSLDPAAASGPQAEGSLLNLINERRKTGGLQPLNIDEGLNKIAKLKSDDMLVNGVSYYSKKYGTIEDMLNDNNYFYINVNYDVIGSGSFTNVLEALAGSSNANEKILNPDCSYIGIGVTDSPDYGKLFTLIYLQK